MRKALFFGVIGLLLAVAMTACGPRDLTREDAKKILETSPLFTPGQSAAHDLNVNAAGLPGVKACAWPANQSLFPRVVKKVTGVGQLSESERSVEFTWLWDTSKYSPETAACFTIVETPARAVLRRYDDGWRVVDVDAKGW